MLKRMGFLVLILLLGSCNQLNNVICNQELRAQQTNVDIDPDVCEAPNNPDPNPNPDPEPDPDPAPTPTPDPDPNPTPDPTPEPEPEPEVPLANPEITGFSLNAASDVATLEYAAVPEADSYEFQVSNDGENWGSVIPDLAPPLIIQKDSKAGLELDWSPGNTVFLHIRSVKGEKRSIYTRAKLTLASTDLEAPKIKIIGNAPNVYVEKTEKIIAEVSDDQGIASVEWWVDDAKVETDSVAPYELNYEFKARDTYYGLKVYAIATDTSGNTNQSNELYYYVDIPSIERVLGNNRISVYSQTPNRYRMFENAYINIRPSNDPNNPYTLRIAAYNFLDYPIQTNCRAGSTQLLICQRFNYNADNSLDIEFTDHQTGKITALYDGGIVERYDYSFEVYKGWDGHAPLFVMYGFGEIDDQYLGPNNTFYAQIANITDGSVKVETYSSKFTQAQYDTTILANPGLLIKKLTYDNTFIPDQVSAVELEFDKTKLTVPGTYHFELELDVGGIPLKIPLTYIKN
ncbi:MAG: hypothetical protein KC422_02250 [Trueperaceae bacterium]|nr:hypothetical protein [Trueperaceae bacterium]